MARVFSWKSKQNLAKKYESHIHYEALYSKLKDWNYKKVFCGLAPFSNKDRFILGQNGIYGFLPRKWDFLIIMVDPICK